MTHTLRFSPQVMVVDLTKYIFIDCTVVYETLTKAINFVREIKKKNPGRELVLGITEYIELK